MGIRRRRRRPVLVLAAVVAAAGSFMPAQAAGVPVAPPAGVLDPGPGFYSDNVEYVVTIPVGATSSAMWVDREYVYSIDYERGIDILRFDRTKPAASEEETTEAWLGKLGVVRPAAAADRRCCRLAVTG